MQDQNVVSLPLKLKGKKSYKVATLHVLKRFEFEPRLLRSGVLAVDSVGSPGQALVFVRGAPESIQQVVGRDNLPADYCQVLMHFQPAHTRPRVQLRPCVYHVSASWRSELG